MTMLEEIVASKRLELMETKKLCPVEDLLGRISEQPPVSFQSALLQPGINIIAEIKYKSPSHGDLQCQLPPGEVAGIYSQSGAVALSVLTEKNYFAGELRFLVEISRELPELPLLRKDFIVDQYQIVEARSSGASAYLLIVSCLYRSTWSVGSELGRPAGASHGRTRPFPEGSPLS